MLRRALSLCSNRAFLSLAIPSAWCALAVACATSTTGTGGFGVTGENGQGGSSGSLGNDNNQNGNSGFGNNGNGSQGLNQSSSGQNNNTTGDGATRPMRCDDAGKCTCFNIASIGLGGHTGAQSGSTSGPTGTDNTAAFIDYLNTESSAGAALIGCGNDVGCTNKAKPTLTSDFLSNYDVLIFQWMADSVVPVTMNGTSYGFTADKGLGGPGYWSWGSDELSALQAWVMGGGGVIILSGYDYCPGNTGCSSSNGELGPTNQIVQALTDISYTATDTFGMTETGNAEFCLGDSDPVTGWAPAPDILGENITAVGGFHGRGITPGANATVDCNSGSTVCAVHEDIGNGHVYVYTDEWVTYTSQWNPPTQPATYCSTVSPTPSGDFPAVQVYYQVPQFWYNAISYASQATMCPFTLPNIIPR